MNKDKKQMDGFTMSNNQNLYKFSAETNKLEQMALVFKFTRYGSANCHIPAPKKGEMYFLAHTMEAAEKTLKKRLKDIRKSKIITKL